MRFLHAWVHGRQQGISRQACQRFRAGDRVRHLREPVPLWHLPRHSRCGRPGERPRAERERRNHNHRGLHRRLAERRCVMPDQKEYSWPPPEERAYIGRRVGRVDGFPKSTGHAKYTYDYNPPGLLYGAFVRSPYPHARITSIDTSAAEAMPGVKAIEIVQKPGTEVHWAGEEIVAIAAVDERKVRDAVRAVKVEYEQLPHLVIDSKEPPHNIPPDTSPFSLDDLRDMFSNQVPANEMIREIKQRGISFKPEEAPLDRMPPNIADAIKTAPQKPPEKK